MSENNNVFLFEKYRKRKEKERGGKKKNKTASEKALRLKQRLFLKKRRY